MSLFTPQASFHHWKFLYSFLSILSVFCIFTPSAHSEPSFLKSNVLRVCSDAGFLPFEMKNNTGEWEGFDIDMMNAFAKSLDVKLEMVQISFDGIIPALLSGKCDMIAAGMTVTPNREKVVAFSQPTFENGLSVAIKNSEKLKYPNFESLDEKGIKFAVKTGYTSDIYLTKILKNAQVLRFDQDADIYLAVLQGRADAFVSDTTFVSLISKQNPGKLSILPTKVTTEKFSVATRKQDKALCDAFDKFLIKWKSSPDYIKTYNKYFKG